MRSVSDEQQNDDDGEGDCPRPKRRIRLFNRVCSLAMVTLLCGRCEDMAADLAILCRNLVSCHRAGLGTEKDLNSKGSIVDQFFEYCCQRVTNDELQPKHGQLQRYQEMGLESSASQHTHLRHQDKTINKNNHLAIRKLADDTIYNVF